MKLPNQRILPPAMVLFLVALAFLIFHNTLGPGKTIFGSDANIGHMAYTRAELPGSFLGRWVENGLVGNPSYMPLKLSSFLMLPMPAPLYLSILIPLELIIGSWALMLFLRGRGLGWFAAAFGAVAAFWLGSNFTLVYAGHIGKFGVLCFSTLTLWLIDLSVRRRSPWVAVLAGAAWGQAFMEQADVAFLFSLFLGVYALYACYREFGTKWVQWVKLLAPIGLVTALFAFGPLSVGYFQNVKSASVMEEASDPDEKWNFVTQWSWPPDESIDFIAPGYFGWRSGEPDGPYWGKLGRSEGWDENRSGFMNFKLENEYMSLLPFLLAISAIWFGLAGRNRRDTLFWTAAAVTAFLLSCGKFSPLYRLAYHLPVISYVRAPVKFLQVFQVALAILAAMGLDAYLRAGPGASSKDAPSIPRKLKWVFVGITGILALMWVGSLFATDAKIDRLAALGWPPATAELLGANIRGALRHAVVIGLIGTGFAFAMERNRFGKWKPLLPIVLVLTLVADAYLLSRHYVQASDTRPVEDNKLALALTKVQGHGRCYAVDQSGLYNAMTGVDFPFHGLEFFNVTQMPRMHADNRQFLDSYGRNIVALWQLTAVQTLLMTDQTFQRFNSTPGFGDMLVPVHRFNLGSDGARGIKADEIALDGTGGHVVAKSRVPSFRYALVTDWSVVPAAEALGAMKQANARPLQKVMISGELPPFMGAVEPAPSQTQPVKVLSHTARHRRLKTVSEAPSILRISERYHPDWIATVDGQPAEILRCDHLFQAVCLPPGIHEVTLAYAPSPAPWILQLLGYSLSGCAGLVLATRLFARPKVTAE